MKIISILIVFLFIITKAGLADGLLENKDLSLSPNTEKSCSVDSDCTVIQGCCDIWNAVNKQYSDNKTYLNDPSKVYLDPGCAHSKCELDPYGKDAFPPVAVCINSECRLTHKPDNAAKVLN
jgi:hypothetical protein